jgi:hypothetical protein
MFVPAKAVFIFAFSMANLVPGIAAAAMYRCSDSFNVPLGFLYVDEAGYEWTKTNSAFEPVEAAENGSGELEYSGPYFVPRSGPMASWGVTGAIGDGFLNINNSSGALMGCREN